ncbi:MAG TPA: hypothetical protein ENK19_08940 [Acidobacteria bacterium]|nr:hypothetical protein [Acidobacteriota bacterium]
MESIEAGALVVLHCTAPREKLWGVLLRLDTVGAVLRGLDLASVEDWLRQLASEGEALLGPSTMFIPTHRLEKIALDESSGPFTSFGERFAASSGRNIRDVLLGGKP